MPNIHATADDAAIAEHFDYLWERARRTMFYQYGNEIGQIVAYAGKKGITPIFVLRINGADVLTMPITPDAPANTVQFTDRDDIVVVTLIQV